MQIHVQADGIFICGKIKEVRQLLLEYAYSYRTISELILNKLN